MFLRETKKLNAQTALDTIAVFAARLPSHWAGRGLNYLDKIKLEHVSITWERSVSIR
jgi:hypothetical protein